MDKIAYYKEQIYKIAKNRDDDEFDKNGKIPALEKAFSDPIEKKVAYMISTSHEYKKPNVKAALAFVKNYKWELSECKLSDLQGINKPVNQAKVDDMAKHMKTVKPFITVNQFHGIRPQTPGKKLLIDGHHRKMALELQGKLTTPIYKGTYTGNAEKDMSELREKTAMIKKQSNFLTKKDVSSSANNKNLKIITGFSGSGKTTLSKKLKAQDPNNILIEIDGFNHGHDSTGKHNIINNFTKDNGFLNKSNPNVNVQKIMEYIQDVAKNNPDNNYIVEGVQFLDAPKELFQKYQTTVKGTGLLKSSIRRLKRDKSLNNSGAKDTIFDAIKYNQKINKNINRVRGIVKQDIEKTPEKTAALKDLLTKNVMPDLNQDANSIDQQADIYHAWKDSMKGKEKTLRNINGIKNTGGGLAIKMGKEAVLPSTLPHGFTAQSANTIKDVIKSMKHVGFKNTIKSILPKIADEIREEMTKNASLNEGFRLERTKDKSYKGEHVRTNMFDKNNNLVGYSITRPDPAKRDNTVALSELYVNPRNRNNGIASKLIGSAKSDNLNKNIVLRALPYKDKGTDKDTLKKIYNSHGFKAAEGLSDKEKRSEDIMIYKPELLKQAALNEGLKFNPFQQRVLDNPNDSVIVAHPVGSGKTVTGIAKFEKLRTEGKAKKALVVVPAGLRDNFGADGVKKFTSSNYNIIGNKQEVSKGTYKNLDANSDYNIMSYEMFRKNPEKYISESGADTVIADEMHKLRNEGTSTGDSFKGTRGMYKNFIGLTGSLVNNGVSDVQPLVDIASNGKHQLGETKKEFETKFVKRNEKGPYKYVKEARRPVTGFKNKELLQKQISNYVDYADVDDVRDMAKIPRKEIENINVPISKQQLKIYRGIINKNPTIRNLISKKRLDTMKDSEIAKAFNALIEARKLMNSVGSVVPGIDLKTSSRITPKASRILDDLDQHIKETPDGQAILMTNLINGGSDVLEAGLKDRHIDYGKFIGKGNKGVTEQSRQKDVEDYKKRKKRVMIISGAGAEGLSLNDTTWEGMFDPHYNPERMNQMEARGIRSHGLMHRPESQRAVDVKRYISTIPKTLGIFTKAPYKTPDQVIYEIANNKDKQNQMLYKTIKEYQKKNGGPESSFWS